MDLCRLLNSIVATGGGSGEASSYTDSSESDAFLTRAAISHFFNVTLWAPLMKQATWWMCPNAKGPESSRARGMT